MLRDRGVFEKSGMPIARMVGYLYLGIPMSVLYASISFEMPRAVPQSLQNQLDYWFMKSRGDSCSF